MPAEYALERSALGDVQVADGDVVVNGKRIHVRVNPGTASLMTVTSSGGVPVHVLTLTREQALRCWRVQLQGQERLLLGEATVLPDGERIRLSATGRESVTLSLYPPLRGGLYSADVRLEERPNGHFVDYDVRFPSGQVEIEVTPLSADRCIVRVPGDRLASAKDIFLRIDYAGDIGEAYIDGALVADNFYNGMTWEIGLKHFADRLAQGELVIKIAPLTRDRHALRYLPTGMAARLDESVQRIARIEAIRAVPEYEVLLCVGDAVV
jgi:hypothetical protein